MESTKNEGSPLVKDVAGEAAQAQAQAQAKPSNSQRSSRSRKQTNVIRTQGSIKMGQVNSTAQGSSALQGTQRSNQNSSAARSAASASQYNKQGPPQSATQKSLRGESEASRRVVTKRTSSNANLVPSSSKEALYRTQGGATTTGFEEAKQTVSSKSNSMAAGSKKGGDGSGQASSRIVTKKKKSRAIAGKDEASARESKNQSVKSKKHGLSQVSNSNAMAASSKDESAGAPQLHAALTVGGLDSPSVSVLAGQTMRSVKDKNPPMRTKTGTSIKLGGRSGSRAGVSPAEPSSSNRSMGNTSKRGGAAGTSAKDTSVLDQVMKSTMKSGGEPAHASISNWDQSQQSEQTKGKSQTTGALPAKKEQPVQPQEATDAPAALDAGATSTAENQPASPASKAPQTQRVSDLRPTPLDLCQQESIEELDESQMSPVSAGPILRTPDNNDNANNFGIRLQKLEIASNLSVAHAQNSSMRLGALEVLPNDPILDEASRPSILESTPIAAADLSSPGGTTAKKLGPDGKPLKLELTEPLPILPKVTTVIHMPIKCPMENIRFVNLKRFQQFQRQQAELMSAGYDLVGQRRKMIQLKTEDRIKKGNNSIENQDQLAKIDDTTHFIKSIVYARDPKVIDQEKQHVHQRDAFSHLNNLDVKSLVAKSQLLGEESKYPSLSPRNVQRRVQRNFTSQPVLDSQIYKLKDPEDKTLLFESRFESGNLYLAQKVSEQEYNLLMSNDINTQGHTQWFFFQVKNTRAKNKVRFNILNYSKPDSLFNYGMKVSVYSEKKSERKQMGWHKDGEDIRYFQNGIRKDVTYYSKSYYTATFTYTFEYDEDSVYFAYSVPYTYSDLRNDLSAIETDPARNKLVRKATLCRTLSGEPCEVLTITSADNLENFRQRKGVVLTARVHPGETVGSWMMRGVLTFLTDPDNAEAKMLRENFVFKVIPMLNPDGVINGNYRCSLAGCDLNRRWKTPNKTLHPTIFHTKRLVKQIHQERGLVLFCDLHGHSRKQNVFMYGCNNKQNPGECRIFPFILSKMNPYFCYDYSRFGVQKSKEATARVAMYKELKSVPNIFTMESSFAGCDTGDAAGKHLTTEMLETLGHDVCRSILIYCNLHVPSELADQPFFKNILLQQQAAAAKKKGNAANLDKKKFKEPSLSIKDAILGEINNNAELLNNAGGDDSSSGSDSAPSEDNLQAEDLIKQLPTADKTLKQQLKKNQEKRKQEEQQQAQSQVKLRRQSSGRNLKKEEPPKRQLSPIKRPLNNGPDKKDDSKPEEKKKPKVETRDACTQTDRSDYQLIKQKMLKERKLKEEQAAQQLAQQQIQQRQGGGAVSSERQLINDLNNRQSDYLSKQQAPTPQMNTTQRLQQMVNLNGDGRSRAQGQKMPLSQHFSQNPLKQINSTGPQTTGNHALLAKNGGTLNHQPSGNPHHLKTTRSELGGPIPANSQKIMIPDKNKYNFMGVSSIKQGQQQPQGSSAGPKRHQSSNENEYGTAMGRPGAIHSSNLSPVRPDANAPSSMLASGAHNVYQTQAGSNLLPREKQKLAEQMKNVEYDQNLRKAGDSRRSGKNGLNGTGELPAMTTLSSNAQGNHLDGKGQAFPSNPILINSMQTNPTHRQPKGSQSFSIAQRSQNFESEPSTQRQGMSSPTTGKPSFVLPQTKHLPQKEFVMLEVGANAKDLRKGSRNNKGGPSQSVAQSHAAASDLASKNPSQSSKFGNQKFHNQAFGQSHHHSTGGGPPPSDVVDPNSHVSRFANQRANPQNIASAEQTLARNNSTHCKTSSSGKYAGPLGASPLIKSGNVASGFATNKNAVDQYQAQLQDMALQQTNVNRNSNGHSQPAKSQSATKNAQPGTQQLRGSLNAHQTPQSTKVGPQWQGAAGHQPEPQLQYRAMGGQNAPQSQSMAHSQLTEHSQECSNKLPALNPRQPQKSGRQEATKAFMQNERQNASGVIGGLNIVLSTGQSNLQTPSQKKPFNMNQHNKFQTQIIQPQMIGTQMQVVSQGGSAVSEGKPGAANSSSVSRQNHHWQTAANSIKHGSTTHQGSKTATGNSSQMGGVKGLASDNSNNTSAATHRRNAHGAIFPANGNGAPIGTTQGHQPQQQMLGAAVKSNGFKPSGSRTPSQQEMHRSGKGPLVGTDILPASSMANKHTLQLQGSPVRGKAGHLGSMSLEEGHITDIESHSPARGMRAPLTDHSHKQKGGSMVTRLRNQSEIADTRNNQSSNYGTYDVHGPPHRHASNKLGGTMGASGGLKGQVVGAAAGGAFNPILTPNVNYSKRSIISNNSQSKVVGKRYSRH